MKQYAQNPWVRSSLAVFLALVLCLALYSPCAAKYRFTLEPGLSVGLTYDDNIDLVNENRRSDWVTNITPSIALGAVSQRTGLRLQYRPSYVRYERHSNDNTLRHNINLNSWHSFSKYLRVEFTDSYLRSDDPFEDALPDGTVLNRRYSYETNRAQVKMDYQFGPRDSLSAGYRHGFARYDDPASSDRTDHGPFAGLTYWFDNRHGIDAGYSFTRYSFKDNQFGVREEPVNAHNIRLGYLHRFSQRTQGSVRYGLSIRDSNDLGEEYVVHQGSVGLDHAFSRTLRLNTHAGAFRKVQSGRNDESGLNYGAQLEKTYQKGSLSLRAESGWDEGYLREDRRGFTRYWTAGVNFRHELTEGLDFHSGLSYRRNDEEGRARDDTIYQGRAGLRWDFHRWYALDLEYQYRKRTSDDPSYEYVNNRVMLTFSWRRAFEWTR